MNLLYSYTDSYKEKMEMEWTGKSEGAQENKGLKCCLICGKIWHLFF